MKLNNSTFRCVVKASVLTIIASVLFPSVSMAESWSKAEIAKLSTLSLNTQKQVSDPSNKYLNNAKAIALGKILFNETGLSSNSNVSCASCHIEDNAFTDNRNLALGLRQGFRNTPSLLDAAQHNWFFADGAKDSLWAQALSSIENPAEQNFTRLELYHFISTHLDYRNSYKGIFVTTLPTLNELKKLPKKAGPNADLEGLKAWKTLAKAQRYQVNQLASNIAKAIAAYVSTLESIPSRLDKFTDELKTNGQSTLLNKSEQAGLKLFISPQSGCLNCHVGAFFSNKEFHNIGTGIPGKDNGRSEIIATVVTDEFNCLGQYSDAQAEQCMELKYVNRDKHSLSGTYKTPTLRGISKTSPYMHDGRYKTLKEVINHYNKVSRDKSKNTDLPPINLNQQQQDDIVNFLLTL